MEKVNELIDAVNSGRQAQIPLHSIDTDAIARDCQARNDAAPRKPQSISFITGRLDAIKELAERIQSYANPAAEADALAKTLSKNIAACEKSLKWASEQKNFVAESADAAVLTKKRLDYMRGQLEATIERRDTSLRIAASLKKILESYGSKEQIQEWRDALKNFEAIEQLNASVIHDGY